MRIELGDGDGHDTREEGYGGAVRFTGFNLADATNWAALSDRYVPVAGEPEKINSEMRTQ